MTTPTPDTTNHATAVLLRHTRTDGSAHLDWLIGPPTPHPPTSDPDARVLTAFRVHADPAKLPLRSSLIAERLPDHRARYLTYQGPLTKDRGDVVRLATYAVQHHPPAPGPQRTLTVAGPNGPVTLVHRPPDEPPGPWTITRIE